MSRPASVKALKNLGEPLVEAANIPWKDPGV
jgi:hypothetical protein